MEDIALTLNTVFLLEEWNLVSQTEFNVLTDVHMSLCTCVKIHVIPNTVFQTEADVVECLLATGSMWRLIEQFTLWSSLAQKMIILMVTVIDMTRRVIEIYSPVNHRSHCAKLELIIKCETSTDLLRK